MAAQNKKPYESPAVESERAFEALAAGCTITADDANCMFAEDPVELLS